MQLYLRDDLRLAWSDDGADPMRAFHCASRQRGELFRDKEGRRTLRFELRGRGYFLKLHQGIGWREIFKNLVQGRLPVLGAGNEFRAIRRLEALGISTLSIAGYGVRGINPARQLSFLVTDELSAVTSLEDLCRDWPQRPPPARVKRALLERLATISRALHAGGVNHRDYYLCHFLLANGGDPASSPLYLMDLHRAQLRRRVPRRWRIKDIGALYYSALDIGLTRRDVLRFMRTYRGMPLRETLNRDRAFWRAVQRRAGRIYRRDFGTEPQWPL